MKQLFQDISTKLLTLLDGDGQPTLKYIRMWNNQLQQIISQQANTELFQMPSAFVEFFPSSIMQLGEGVQLYDPLDIDIHILDWLIDAGDGTFEQNLEVFDLKQKVFQTLQKFKPDLCGSFVRVSETHDQNHPGVYHFIMRFRTNYVDKTMQEPVEGGEFNTPMPLDLEVEVQDSADVSAPHQYLFTPS